MTDFLAMHGYGTYIWSAYAVFALTFIADALAPVFQRRKTLRELQARLRRAARKSP
ncbi:MAG: heme exporter protein CcmD [Rudaea sp.]